MFRFQQLVKNTKKPTSYIFLREVPLIVLQLEPKTVLDLMYKYWTKLRPQIQQPVNRKIT